MSQDRTASGPFMADFRDLFEIFELRYTDVRDLGDRVLALGTTRSVARRKRISSRSSPLRFVATYKDGLLTHWKDYGDKQRHSKPPGCRSRRCRRRTWRLFKRGNDCVEPRGHRCDAGGGRPRGGVCMRWLRRCLEVNRRSTADTRESANCFETYTRLSHEHRIEISEIRDLGERVLAVGQLRMRGTGSGAEVESPIAYVVEFKNGKIIRVRRLLRPQRGPRSRRAAGVGDV